MYSEAKMLAYAKWHELLTDSEILMDAEERYDELLKLADDYACRGIIDRNCNGGLCAIGGRPFSVERWVLAMFLTFLGRFLPVC